MTQWLSCRFAVDIHTIKHELCQLEVNAGLEFHIFALFCLVIYYALLFYVLLAFVFYKCV